MKTPTAKIIEHVAGHVLPMYDERLAYKRGHVEYVMRRSVLFANQVAGGGGVDVDMAYVAAAYHDIGEAQDRKTHELIGANMLRNDEKLRQYFSGEQVELMAQAVEDHRASGKAEPRSVYGRIVSSADRITNIDDMCVLMFNAPSHKGMTRGQNIDASHRHLSVKFGEGGYALAKMYFDDPEFEAFKEQAVALSKDKVAFAKRFLAANGITG